MDSQASEGWPLISIKEGEGLITVKLYNINDSIGDCALPLCYSQFITYENLDIYGGDQCTCYSVVPVIKAARLVATIEGESLEGQRLTGRKLLVSGCYKTRLLRESLGSISKLELNIPFSTYIVVPKDSCCSQEVILKYFIEDTAVISIDRNKLFISICTLLAYCENIPC